MERRLTAILAADVVGYSRMMGADEAGTLAALKSIRVNLIDTKIGEHQGRIVKLTGDGILAEFPSIVSAVACAAEIQRELSKRNVDVPPDCGIQFRVGINLGDVIVEDDDIYGDGVNVAARLQSIAPIGGIAVSSSVRDQVGNRLDLKFADQGEQSLKNIANPVRVYHVVLNDKSSGATAVAPGPPASQVTRPSIAVLPFINMSGDPEQEYFSDGITEDLITDLAKASGLSVVARNTVFIYKGKPAKVEELARELGVSYILEGSVRKSGNRVRITGQLVNGKDGRQLWADRFDRDLTDIFAIQDEIAQAIVAQLKVRLLPQEKSSIQVAPTGNVEAYTYYLRGRQFLHRHSKSYYELARRMFSLAVDLDPDYARAYAGIADCDSFLFVIYHAKIPIADILATTEKALALDETLAEAHASRGFALSIEQRYDEATIEFEKAIALDPNSFEAHYFYARACYVQGKLEQSAELFKRAADIKPNDYQSLVMLVQTYRSLGLTADTTAAAEKTVERAERELVLHPENPRPAYLGAAALVTLGANERAREWLARALAIAPEDVLTLYNTACVYTRLGDTDVALDLLERSLPYGGPEPAWIKHDSSLDGLRNFPRFRKLLELVG